MVKMKSTGITTRVVLIAFAAVFVPIFGFSQRSDESVRVKVHKTQEGHTLQIEDAVPAGDAENLKDLMEKSEVSNQINEMKPGEEVEIVIHRTQEGNQPAEVTFEVENKPATQPEPVVAKTIPTPTPTPAPVTLPTPTPKPVLAVTPTPTPKPIVATTPKPVAKPLEKKPAFLGVHYEMEFGSTSGSHITKVEPGTPAFKAGLKPGDVITQADGVDLYQLEDLAEIISKKKAGEKVKITFERAGKVITSYVTLEERDDRFFQNNPGGSPTYRLEQIYEPSSSGNSNAPDERGYFNANADAGPLLGVVMTQLPRKFDSNGIEIIEKSNGALVENIIPNTAASEIGLRKGDRIIAVNGRSVFSPSDVTLIVAKLKTGDKINLAYTRAGSRLIGAGTLKDRQRFNLPTLEGTNIIISMR
jgi:predicted metalloprotease with PDZ domain